MKIEFDPAKDEVNRAKHGLSLAVAADMDFSAALIEPDQLYNYGEARFQAIGLCSPTAFVTLGTAFRRALRDVG